MLTISKAIFRYTGEIVMPQDDARQRQVEAALTHVTLPQGILIRAWTENDFPAIQRLSHAEGWPTPQIRPDEALIAWQQSWPTLNFFANPTFHQLNAKNFIRRYSWRWAA